MKLGLRALGSNGLGKHKKLLIIGLLLLLAGFLIVWKLHSDKVNKTDETITLKQQNSYASNYANKNLEKKNYDAAVQGYVSASATAFYQKDYEGSKNQLQACIDNIPADHVPWYVYNSLYVTAKQLNDVELEKSSLQNAISKAQAPNSGASAETIDGLKQTLQGIK